MTKKEKVTVFVIAIIILVTLIIPIPRGSYDDGGTSTYQALIYKIVVWNKLHTVEGEDGLLNEIKTYHKTSVYWFPNNMRSIGDLWEIEQENLFQN